MWEKVAKDSEKGSPSERVFIYYNNAARNFELAGNADKAKEIRRKVANGRRIQAKNYEREKFFQDAAKHYDNAAVNFEFAGDADRAKEMRRKVADAWKIQAENFEKDRKYQLAGKYYNLAFVFFKQSMNTHEAGAAQEKAFLCFKKLDQHAIEKAKNNLQIISHCNSSSAAFALCNENMEILGNFGDLLQIIDTCCTTADALCKKNNLTREELTMCATSHEKAAEYCCEINWHDRAVIEWTAAAEIFEKLGDHVSVIACYTKIVEACKNIGNTKKIEAMEKKLEENRANFQNKAKTIYDNAQPMVGSTTAPLTIGSAQIDANAPSTTDGAQIGTAATNDPQAPTIRGRLKFKNSK
jgi:tetratricopeptide (TPR) repeat protein